MPSGRLAAGVNMWVFVEKVSTDSRASEALQNRHRLAAGWVGGRKDEELTDDSK